MPSHTRLDPWSHRWHGPGTEFPKMRAIIRKRKLKEGGTHRRGRAYLAGKRLVGHVESSSRTVIDRLAEPLEPFMRYASTILAALLFILPAPRTALHAQTAYTPSAVSAGDYARAEGFLNGPLAPLVFGMNVRPNWLADGRFWYRNAIPQGHEFVMVDPEHRSRDRAFDHQRMAAALAQISGTPQTPFDLPLTEFEGETGQQAVAFEIDGKGYACDARVYSCQALNEAPTAASRPRGPAMARGASEVLSPDGAKAAFIRDNNLWIREVATGGKPRRPSTAWKTSAMQRITPVGPGATDRWYSGPRTPGRSPPSSMTDGGWA